MGTVGVIEKQVEEIFAMVSYILIHMCMFCWFQVLGVGEEEKLGLCLMDSETSRQKQVNV